jgi:hypothetical protein
MTCSSSISKWVGGNGEDFFGGAHQVSRLDFQGETKI